MTTLQIYQDSKGDGTCRSCGAAIVWAELTSGKRHPFNAPLIVDGVPQLAQGARVVETVANYPATSHFATCPHAVSHRHRR